MTTNSKDILSLAANLKREGLTWGKVADGLNEAKYFTPTGNNWTGPTICNAAIAIYPELRTYNTSVNRKIQKKLETKAKKTVTTYAPKSFRVTTNTNDKMELVKIIADSNLSQSFKVSSIEKVLGW